MYLNKVILCGFVGKKPKLESRTVGKKHYTVCNFQMATSIKTGRGKKNTKVTWHNIVTWSTVADACAKFVCKGRHVLVEGFLDYDNYVTADGQKANFCCIQATTVTFLDKWPEKREGEIDDESDEP